MAHNKLYRNFIILQEDEKGHGISEEKPLSGYAKIEAKGDKCKISFYAQNLNKDDKYTIVLICYKKDMKQIVDLGSLEVTDVGKGEACKEYYINNIAGLDFSYEKVSGAAICKYKDGELSFLMYGFMNGENVKDGWKKCKLLKHADKDDTMFKKDISKIEITQIKEKESKKEQDCKKDYHVHTDKEEHCDNKDKYDEKGHKEDNHEEGCGDDYEDKHEEKHMNDNGKEHLHHHEENHVSKHKNMDDCEVEHIHLHKEDYIDKHEEKHMNHDDEENMKEHEEDHCDEHKEDDCDEHKEDDMYHGHDEQMNDHKEKHMHHNKEKYSYNNEDDYKYDYYGDKEYGFAGENHDERIKASSKFDEYENSIEKNKDNKEDFSLNGDIGKFFTGIMDGFEEYEPKCKDIKYCKWYKINVKSLDDMCNIGNYNKYTVAYYPMLNYYPYIRKYGYFLIGYKCDPKGNLKYIVYGVPGKKDENEQPYAGKTGFVTWMKPGEQDEGCWLMFYDFRNSTIVVPMK